MAESLIYKPFENCSRAVTARCSDVLCLYAEALQHIIEAQEHNSVAVYQIFTTPVPIPPQPVASNSITMSDLFKPAPQPPTELGRYRILSSTAGVRVSPLQLGAMSIGEAWKDFMGSMDKEQSFKLLDAYYEACIRSRMTDNIANIYRLVGTSSTQPTTTRTRNPRSGLENG